MLTTLNHHDHHDHQQQSRVLQDFSSLILNILRDPPSPSTLNLSNFLSSSRPLTSSSSSSAVRFPSQLTVAGFASLMLGISLTLMLCGLVTFFIGFMLLPWVIGLVMVFYIVGLVTTISVLGRTFLCYATSSSSCSPQKDFPGSEKGRTTTTHTHRGECNQRFLRLEKDFKREKSAADK